MKDTTPPPPDMTREQARELKDLRAREARLNKAITRQAATARRRIERIDAEIAAHHARLLREAKAKQRAFSAPLRKEARVLRTQIHRGTEQRTPQHKELSALSRRIAILEGRLGS